VLGELAASKFVARLKLHPLSLTAVRELAEPHGVDAEALFRRTGGNPFFVGEALAAGAEEIPETVRDAVLARAGRLGPSAMRMLEAVAIVPGEADLWLLEALASEAMDGLGECLSSGMLISGSASVGFRHELARLAVEKSVAPDRRVDLHRRALAALVEPQVGTPDLARLAHHAEAAGDVDAVLRFAPAAAERASSLGAHREAVAQYGRALRFGDRLSAGQRAELLERRAAACLLTDQYDEGIAALEEALECRRAQGDRLREGDDLCRLAEFLWCPGRTAEAERSAREAVALLEDLPPSRELARAYARLGSCCATAARSEEAVRWIEQALELAESLGVEDVAIDALKFIGESGADYDKVGQAFDRAEASGLEQHVAWGFLSLAAVAAKSRRNSLALEHLEAGIAYTRERGLELASLYLLASRARIELKQGRWEDAAATAAAVLRIPRSSTSPRIAALVVLALVRGRRGDPEVRLLLDEAWALAEPTRELHRLAPVAAARAEVAWLQGDRYAVDEVTEGALELAVERNASGFAGELAVWRRRAGIDETPREWAVAPYDLQLAGDWARAAESWREIGCPYEAALALADGDEEEPLRRALVELQQLGARPAAAIVAGRLRQLGVRGVPRGPRPGTQSNSAGLTRREQEVLALVNDELRNAEIAERLVLSERTVDTHVAAILRKLNVRSRRQACTEAIRLGLVSQDT